MRTGFYIRIQRDGRWQALDIVDFTEEERATWIASLDETVAKRWLAGLIKFLAEHGS